ncbi:hypothetical protein EI171_22535 [Bradyrhizobium sp. LCT2]|uniref:hypothetical protein n=1 Tax=Bradyrhizobium sp. LCT2 TaxID=2493093 RepID=UPI0013742733|nr:hypothetical protein [Bradyrhizobium sp. LCT2]QHP69825.1 hypothetical protein EI171_22535 [Bradyrhizobium sp. LCT2]
MERWDKLNFAFEYLLQFISLKPAEERYQINSVELALVSNFKGGNNSVVEPLHSLGDKLLRYSCQLSRLAKLIAGRDLRQIQAIDSLGAEAGEFLALSARANSKIAGFGPSYASALLAAYFPQTLPIVDRQVLRGADIGHDVDESGQVVSIANYYPMLLRRFRDELEVRPRVSVRELDREWFIRGSKINRARRAENRSQ